MRQRGEKRVNRAFVNQLFPQREILKYQERREDIQYHFTDDINKIDKILDKPYQNIAIEI